VAAELRLSFFPNYPERTSGQLGPHVKSGDIPL
jgi:hypothetical protein